MAKLLILKALKVSQALSIVGLKKSTFYYRASPEDKELMEKIKSIAENYYFYGYRKIWAELRKNGYKVNHKKIYRLYRMMNLQRPAPIRSRKKIPSSTTKLTEPEFPNHIWAMDFTFTKLSNGRIIKILAIEDIYSKKALITLLGFSITSSDVIEALRKAWVLYGKPVVIRSDNGPEFRAKALRGFLVHERVRQEFIPKGSPYLNGVVERFMGNLKGECLVSGIFNNLNEVDNTVKSYQNFYNRERLHQSIDYRVPDSIFYARDNIEKEVSLL